MKLFPYGLIEPFDDPKRVWFNEEGKINRILTGFEI